MPSGRKTFKNVHVDCDPWVYLVGFVTEDVLWDVEGDGNYINSKCDAMMRCIELGIEFSMEMKVIRPQPFKNAVFLLNKKLRRVRNEFNCSRMYLYLSPRSNFRTSLTDTYKAQRVGMIKPFYYQRIRDWLLAEGAKIVDNYEADDIVSINHVHGWTKGGRKKSDCNSLIYAVDKDFNNIPGWHYNPDKDELRYISVKDAIVHFYRQVIEGDAVDNVKGLKGRGKVFAEKLIDGSTSSEKALYLLVRQAYLDQYKDTGRTEEDILRELLINCHMLYILWYKEQFFKPPYEEDLCLNSQLLEKIQTSLMNP